LLGRAQQREGEKRERDRERIGTRERRPGWLEGGLIHSRRRQQEVASDAQGASTQLLPVSTKKTKGNL
jgi:hypothetical protein